MFIAKEVIVDIELKLIACIVGIVLGALLSMHVRVQLVPAVALFGFLLGLCFVKVWTLFSGTKFAPEPAMFLRLFSSLVFCLVIADESSSIFFILYSLVYVDNWLGMPIIELLQNSGDLCDRDTLEGFSTPQNGICGKDFGSISHLFLTCPALPFGIVLGLPWDQIGYFNSVVAMFEKAMEASLSTQS
ncbi:hypothetical protein FNV43_RR04451 [Rhamnella rubrinervis]|uniref:Uncharacterized protein n=1 Tax=Rhamnella rubrinervis TaxID=2594499 RepID=A0A8K0HL19_9ROSA|nr:hypothetical protein FNV43_RR04451 [Rhamnella rubrinervis]